jgi:hypothetical protein
MKLSILLFFLVAACRASSQEIAAYYKFSWKTRVFESQESAEKAARFNHVNVVCAVKNTTNDLLTISLNEFSDTGPLYTNEKVEEWSIRLLHVRFKDDHLGEIVVENDILKTWTLKPGEIARLYSASAPVTLPKDTQLLAGKIKVIVNALVSTPNQSKRFVSDTIAVTAEELIKRWEIRKEVPEVTNPFQTEAETEPNQRLL